MEPKSAKTNQKSADPLVGRARTRRRDSPSPPPLWAPCRGTSNTSTPFDSNGSNLDPFEQNGSSHQKKSAAHCSVFFRSILEALKRLGPFSLNGLGCLFAPYT